MPTLPSPEDIIGSCRTVIDSSCQDMLREYAERVHLTITKRIDRSSIITTSLQVAWSIESIMGLADVFEGIIEDEANEKS